MNRYNVPPSPWTPGARNRKKQNLLRHERYLSKAREYVTTLNAGEKAALLATLTSGDASPLDQGVQDLGIAAVQPISIFRRMINSISDFWNDLTAP